MKSFSKSCGIYIISFDLFVLKSSSEFSIENELLFKVKYLLAVNFDISSLENAKNFYLTIYI